MREQFDYGKWLAGLKSAGLTEEVARVAAAYNNGCSTSARQYRAALLEQASRTKKTGAQMALF
jgi:hypothetical protein